MSFPYKTNSAFTPIFSNPYLTFDSNMAYFPLPVNNFGPQRIFFPFQNREGTLQRNLASNNSHSNELIPSTQTPQRSQVSRSTRKRRKRAKASTSTLSVRKNGEPNIIHQFYSFFSIRQRSEDIVKKCIELLGKSHDQAQKALPFFYMVFRIFTFNKNRKYTNATKLVKLFESKGLLEQLSQVDHGINIINVLTYEQLSEVIRRCASYFIKEISIRAILTSKRIRSKTKAGHLECRRKILKKILNT